MLDDSNKNGNLTASQPCTSANRRNRYARQPSRWVQSASRAASGVRMIIPRTGSAAARQENIQKLRVGGDRKAHGRRRIVDATAERPRAPHGRQILNRPPSKRIQTRRRLTAASPRLFRDLDLLKQANCKIRSVARREGGALAAYFSVVLKAVQP